MQIIQEQTKTSPGISYNPDTEILKIIGRSIPENPEIVFKPLKNWITGFFESGNKLKLSIVLEYINSGSSKHMIEILKLLRSYQADGKILDITWFYEEDDEAIMELGEHFRDTSALPIKIEMLLDEDE